MTKSTVTKATSGIPSVMLKSFMVASFYFLFATRSRLHLFDMTASSVLNWLPRILVGTDIPIDPVNYGLKKRSEIGERIGETGFYQSLEILGDKPLFSTDSKYQDIEIYETVHYGKTLVLDGVVQLTAKDADSYNEMMAHIPMFEHPAPKRILVIGGGDGYVLHETLKHNSVVEAHHVDLDEKVIEVCRKYFMWGKVWSDPRVKLYIADGAKFVRDAPTGYYDVIIQDSSDPFTWTDDGGTTLLPSSTLYTEEHFQNLHRILSQDGVFNFQAESFAIPSDLQGVREWRQRILGVGFSTAKYGSIHISSYPTGQIGFLLCKKNNQRTVSNEDVKRRFQIISENGEETSYYQPKLQKSSFDLPLWVERAIYGDEN